MGSMGSLMGGLVLEDIFCFVTAMMTGKAYARALCGQLLVGGALML